MARAEFCLDGRDFPAALLDSLRLPPTLLSDLIEGTSIALQRRLLSREALPARHDHVHILGVQLEAITNALGGFRRRQRCAAAEERIVNYLPTFRVVQNRSPHQLDGLLTWMVPLL